MKLIKYLAFLLLFSCSTAKKIKIVEYKYLNCPSESIKSTYFVDGCMQTGRLYFESLKAHGLYAPNAMLDTSASVKRCYEMFLHYKNSMKPLEKMNIGKTK